MEFWNKNNIEYYRIEDSGIFKAKTLSPDYLQEKDLSNSNLKKLRSEWQKVFPKLDNLKYLYLGHRVNQEYFEAVCQIPNLKGLWVKTSQIKDFSPIGNLRELEQLNFGGSLAIPNLEGIQNLTNLKYCVLDKFFGLESLNELSNLKSLKKLHLFGGFDAKTLNIKSLEPLSELSNLEELALAIKTNLDIRPLLKLKKLVIPDFYHSKIKNELPKRTKLR
ncbi:leucine-rich repeat domain-containing protein [Mangrovimonas sp. TPBH4]|uniref:leucine-rich repeat domain-containing protein n=1 Tax=Mangrovimonas sp. TPBH4 TaxID=1645914 RepID=UPI0006B3FA19|nr:leucine-rich repeat domain-containing protein [Mangrovimonas sp. TPBH4]